MEVCLFSASSYTRGQFETPVLTSNCSNISITRLSTDRMVTLSSPPSLALSNSAFKQSEFATGIHHEYSLSLERKGLMLLKICLESVLK